MDKNMKDPNKPEAAVQMMNDPDTREELLASLKGRKKPKYARFDHGKAILWQWKPNANF